MKITVCQFLLIAVLFFSFSACRIMSPKPDTPPAKDAAELHAAIIKAGSAVQNVQADGKLEFFSKDRHDRVTLTWIVQKPDKALLEVTGPTGLLAVTALNGLEFQSFDPKNRRLLIGPASKENLSSILPFPVNPDEIVPILCASPPLVDAKARNMKYDEKAKRWRLLLQDDRGWTQALWLSPEGYLHRVILIDASGNTRYEVTYLAWKDGENGKPAFPGFIKIAHPQSQTRITLKLHGHPTLNDPIDPTLFTLQVPEAIPRERVGEEKPSAFP